MHASSTVFLTNAQTSAQRAIVTTRNFSRIIRDFDKCIAKTGGKKISVYNQHPSQVEPGTIPKNIVSTRQIYIPLERAYYVILSHRPETSLRNYPAWVYTH